MSVPVTMENVMTHVTILLEVTHALVTLDTHLILTTEAALVSCIHINTFIDY